MKKIILLFSLFFYITFYAQNDTISDVKNSKISEVYIQTENVLYLGFKNRIFINVPNPETLTASMPGLTAENGKYYVFPKSLKEQTLFLTFKSNDGIIISEKHTFKVKVIPIAMGFINGNNCEKCIVELKKEELKDAIITLKFPDVLLDINLNVTEFRILILTKKTRFIDVTSNKIDYETYNILSKLKKGTEFYIWDFKFNHNLGDALICKTTAIKIKIID